MKSTQSILRKEDPQYPSSDALSSILFTSSGQFSLKPRARATSCWWFNSTLSRIMK